MAETDSKVEILVEEGLQLYSQGKLDDALESWRAALAIVPGHTRAEEYIRYNAENRAALEKSFGLDTAELAAVTAAEGKSAEEPPAEAPPAEEPPDEVPPVEEPPVPAATKEADPQFDLMIEAEYRNTVKEVDSTARMDLDDLKVKVAATVAEQAAKKAAAREASRNSTSGAPRDRAESESAPGQRERKEDRTDGARRADRGLTEDTRQVLIQDSDDTKKRENLTPTVPMVEPRTRTRSTTPSSLIPAIAQPMERSRRATSLTLVEGEGDPPPPGFDPLEKTPVASNLPEPARLVNEEAASESFEEEEVTPLGAAPLDDVQMLSTKDDAPANQADSTDQIESMLSGAQQLHEQGTYEGSLWLCERVLKMDAANEPAKALLDTNRGVLLGQYKGQIGDLGTVPVVQIPQHEIMWHKLDHRAGFLLSRIDGQLSFEDIIDVSGMEEFEASRILAQLLSLNVISSS